MPAPRLHVGACQVVRSAKIKGILENYATAWRLEQRHAAEVRFDQRRILRLIVVVSVKLPDLPVTVMV